MAAATQAQAPSAVVTEIPGRYSPIYIVDKRGMGTVASDTGTSSRLAFLPRTESVDSSFTTPTTAVDELGTNFHVGDYDDLPESKLTIQAHDVSYVAMSLVTGKDAPTGQTTTWGFNELATAQVDVVRQFADPNGKIFASMYMGDMVIEEFGLSLKAKSDAMESYALTGFNMMMFRGQIITKAYKATGTEAGTIDLSTVFGADEGPVKLPTDTVADYWTQRGCIYFLKVDRYRAATGWTRLKETSGAVATGVVKFDGTHTLTAQAADIAAGDVFYFTFCTYKTDVVALQTIPQTTIDTSDPIAISTRLTPFTISGANVSRGQGFDLKMTMKRDRAEGIGDTDGMYGPPAAPECSLSIDVKATDFGLLALMTTGSVNGTDNGGTSAGDFFDPNKMTRHQLNTDVPIVVTLNDPRNAGAVMKTITAPTALFTQFQNSASTKNVVTHKFTGKDRVGNVSVSVTR